MDHEAFMQENAKQIEELRTAFPTAFKHLSALWIDPGWMPVVREMGQAIEAELAKRDAEYRESFQLSTIKEKWARLVTYYYEGEELGRNSIINGILAVAAEKAAEMCETCGGPGRLVANHNEWWRVKCSSHRAPDESPSAVRDANGPSHL